MDLNLSSGLKCCSSDLFIRLEIVQVDGGKWSFGKIENEGRKITDYDFPPTLKMRVGK